MAVYGVFYMLAFRYLEERTVYGYHVVHTVFDDLIPFCEYFIVPYLLWFPYVLGTVVYFIFFNKNKREFYQLSYNLMMGMTVFLVVSYVYPNIQYLRPTTFAHHNVFTALVQQLYAADTPTNILPSIHVFNSLAVHMAIASSESLKNKKFIKNGSLILTTLIVLATMFLKQHTVIDVCMAITLALFGLVVFYPEQAKEVTSEERWIYHHNAKHRHNF